jgi:hypothetical protein
MFTQVIAGTAKNKSRQRYMLSVQVADTTFVALVVPVCANLLMPESGNKLR